MPTPAHNPTPHIAPELLLHGYVITRPVRGSDIPADYTFVLTRDEIYVPIGVRRPRGEGPFPVITMGRGDGRAGVPHVERQIERLAAMQERMLARGYVVVYVNYRNEIPHLYETIERAANLPDSVSGGATRTLKSAPTLDSDDFVSILRYLRTLPYVDADAIGAVGGSHGGEIILKVAAETNLLAAGVAVEGASHEFLGVDTGPNAPRKGAEIQYQDIEVARRNADRARAMDRIRRIATPILHIGRDHDHLQGIARLAHEWMLEAGKDSTWVSFDHPDHCYPFIYVEDGGSYAPHACQQQAFDIFMDFFDQRMKHSGR